MKTLKIIARDKIIDPHTKTLHNDAGLRALDGLREYVININDDYKAIDLVNDLIEKYPELEYWSFEIVEFFK